MPISDTFNLPTGVTVNIVTTDAAFTGEFIEVVDNYMVIRLTTATTPFVAGQVIRINLDKVIAFG